ncbi:DNA polymerase III subunit gamma/tau [Acinetobacter shaoyimingii]|uniref:DNA polymerase III subunit gamma/tau n=1 Tax=Acinetobacter shaoyimingii TaxID=2715164 RepID=A0A6G8RUT9_9GAMM|nr:DNA polymerase III subunit gamma/tau [Acinetobacter shaoyimingii]QIO05709.1 DNA polymerase III subunit gamma/tau [Acinetobacter shaoyimingii]
MYQVLARKYRPRNFIELVGQNHVSRALTSALERGRLHHAYLFTGTRGVGKTTIARILAKCLNCETGVTSTPCEVCATCTAVNEGRFIDLIEIDAASRTKVEDTRELLDNVPYAPTQGRFKVYLIDEVHMLSTHSFNALLKTLEEPPEHVKFLFATTDPQKLPITVISRCLQFTLRPLTVDEITSHLTNILSKESIPAESDAIWQIAESAQGSLRDSLSLTDQAIAYGQGEIRHQDVKEMLGLIDRTIIYDLILAIHQNQRQRVSELLLQFRQQALDVSLVLDQFISTLHELALLQYLPDLALKYSAEINQKIMQLSALLSAQDLQLYYQIACKGRADLQMAVTQEQGFEMCVLRLLAFRPMQPNEVVVQQHTQVSTSQVSAQQYSSSALISQHVIEQKQDDLSETLTNLNHDDETQIINQESKTVDTPLASDFDDFQGSYDDDEFSLNSNVEGTDQATVHEPSSDDYLEDEILNEDITPHLDTLESSSSSAIAAENDVEPIHVQQAIQHEQTSQLDEPSLTSFGEPIVAEAVLATTEQQDVFFLAPEADVADAVVDSNAQTPSLPLDSMQLDTEQVIVDEVVEDNQSTENPVQHAATLKQKIEHSSDSKLLPQDILKLQPQELSGEWTLDKWEYWFRQSDLSPAVQELAQQGIMSGQIDGASTFTIPAEYEQMLTQLQHVLEGELKKQWPHTVFHVQYKEITTTTPYTLQAERKERAFNRASELLHAEPVVKSLVEAFEGEIHQIQLKP